MTFPYDESVGLKHVGYECIGDKFLKEEMQKSGNRRKCAYCGKVSKGYRLVDVALRVEKAFETFYIRTAADMDGFEYAMHNDREISYEWERNGQPVIEAIAEALESENDIAEDVQAILADKNANWDPSDPLEETEFHADSYYTSNETSDKWWRDQWEKFESSIKSQSRFFNREGTKLLKKVFEGIQEMSARGGRPIVKTIGPRTGITSAFRARVFQSDARLSDALKSPALHIGPPPSQFASSGRMNARGISVFYGAIDEETALAEVRPPVGSQVIVGEFTLTRRLKVLDLTALPDIKAEGSIFDPDFAAELERITFLSNLTSILTRPVMPDDEVFDYLPTQAIADFLSSEPPFEFDGLLFPSAQVEGAKQNMVLFHKSSRVAEETLPAGTKTEVQLWGWEESGPYRNYQVIERVPEDVTIETEEIPLEEKSPVDALLEELESSGSADPRQVTLKLIVKSVKVHVIKAVKILSEDHSVYRLRYTDTPITDD
ncbi:RES family NAD+ phosphorylase [Mucilaginibacter rubeus]|uniref:RES domain-containing protein n=1 Tax=Mucilaginibacter rubeus TaxID=2027860 RepID=A0AAE6JK33_9SPHI|nr:MULTISPECIES: RES domain-containing protein [Mucilaginibacter]QEM07199.1 RES family NAD+ phosphorylase [Mucilaginibacter rubeus]QEM19655.1 RES family NAD+ phosphorylase [Mucilaginibacter gossypii]QTE43649.1 RES domain-containing protein [Mucilaginibacter rubeus]QTE50249.1 RES domain-containing protein [Mucilaginibacter rubeus]QTE55337.1 RES domain-containing protein [Mucilaginibacter rubeus]